MPPLQRADLPALSDRGGAHRRDLRLCSLAFWGEFRHAGSAAVLLGVDRTDLHRCGYAIAARPDHAAADLAGFARESGRLIHGYSILGHGRGRGILFVHDSVMY